jgi:methanogenic corrinoid protein MtbC1
MTLLIVASCLGDAHDVGDNIFESMKTFGNYQKSRTCDH